MRRFVDLHTHSIASDGTLRPAELIRLAERARLAAVAVLSQAPGPPPREAGWLLADAETVAAGRLKPGDDLLFIIVAGDIRENVKPVLAELLDRIKAEAVTKSETKV